MPDFIEEDEIFRVDPHEVATSTEQRSEMPSTSVGEVRLTFFQSRLCSDFFTIAYLL